MAPIIAASLIAGGAGIAGSLIGSRNAPETGEVRKHMPRYLDMNRQFFNQQQGFSRDKAQLNASLAGRYNSFYQALSNRNSASASAQENRNWNYTGRSLFDAQGMAASRLQNNQWTHYGKNLFRDQAFTASRTANEQWGQFGKPLFQDQQRTIAQSELSNLQSTSVGRGQAERAYLDAKFPGASTWDLLGSGGGAGAGAGAIPGAPGMPAPSPGSVSGRGVAGVDPRMVDAAALRAQSELKGQYQSELVAQAAAQETQAAIVKAQLQNQMGVAATNSIAGIVQAALSSNKNPHEIAQVIAQTQNATAQLPGIQAQSTLKSGAGLVNDAGGAIRSGVDYVKSGELSNDVSSAASNFGAKVSDWTAENGPKILREMEHNYHLLQQEAAEMSSRIKVGLEALFNKHGSKSVRPVKKGQLTKPGIQPKTIYITK